MAHVVHAAEQLRTFAIENRLGRLWRLEDVTGAFLFLARAGYVNGMAR